MSANGSEVFETTAQSAQYSQTAINDANELNTLFNAVRNLHDVYYDKGKWASIYPKIAYLADRLDTFLSKHPHLSLSLTQIYIKQHGYTTNLVINQMVLSFIIANALMLNKKARLQVLEASLILYLSVRNENNLLSQNITLDRQQKKAWASRYVQASRLLTKYTNGMKNVKLLLVQFASNGSGKRASSFRDELFTIVWLANEISKKITLSKVQKAVSIQQAIKSIYLNKVNSQIRYTLNALCAYLPSSIPGSIANIDNTLCVYVKDIDNGNRVYLSLEAKPECFISKQNSPLLFRPQTVESTRQLWAKWQAVQNYLLVHDRSNSNPPTSTARLAVNDIKRAANISLKKVVGYISPHPELVNSITKLATTRTRANAPVTDLQHAIALLGVDNLVPIIELLSYQQKIKQVGFLNAHFLQARIEFLMRTIEMLSRKHNYASFDQINAYICKTLLFNLQSAKANVSPIKQASEALSSYSPARLFRITKNLVTPSDKSKLSSAFSDVLGGNINTLACDEISPASTLAFALIGCNTVFDPQLKCSSLELQIQARLVASFGYASFHEYVQALVSLNPKNSI